MVVWHVNREKKLGSAGAGLGLGLIPKSGYWQVVGTRATLDRSPASVAWFILLWYPNQDLFRNKRFGLGTARQCDCLGSPARFGRPDLDMSVEFHVFGNTLPIIG